MPEAAETPPAEVPAGLSRAWLWRKYGLGLPAALLLLLALALIVLDSPIGHRLLADTLAELETPTGLRMEVGRIDGSIFGSAVLEDVTLRDPQGAFLRVPETELDWRPLDWFAAGLDIRRLVLRRGTLLRLPHLRPGDPNAPLLPDFDIRIDRLEVQRLTVARPVLGTERRIDLRARALVRKRSAYVSLQGRLGGGDRLALLLDADRAANRFDIGLDYAAPKGGLLAAVTGAKADRTARIAGKGGWTDWRGTLTAAQGSTRLAALALTNRAGHFGLSGQVWTASLLGINARTAIGEAVTLQGNGTYADNTLNGTLAAQSPRLHVAAAGGVNLAASRVNHLAITARTLAILPLDPETALAGARLQADLDGRFGEIAGHYALSADQLTTGKITLAGFTARGTAQRQGLHWRVPATVTAGRVVTIHAAINPQLVGGRGQGVLIFTGSHVASNDVALSFPTLSARLALAGDIAQGGYAVEGRAQARGWHLGAIGRASADASLLLKLGRGGYWDLAAQLTGQVPAVESHAIASLAGDRIHFAGAVRGASGQPLLISRATLAGDRLTMALAGQRREDGTAQITGTGHHASYGSFTLAATVAPDGPHAALVFEDPLPAAGIKDMHVALAPAEGGLRIDASGASLLGPFIGTLGLTLPPEGRSDAPARLDFQNFEIWKTAVTGALDLGTGGASGNLALAGGGVSGTVHLAPRGGGEGLDLALAATDAHFGGDQPLTIGAGKLEASGLLAKGHSTLTGSMLVQGIGAGRLFIGKAALSTKLADGYGQLTASFAGRRGSRFDLQTLADIAPGHFALLAHGLYAGQPIRMPRRAVLTAETEGWRLAPSEIDFGAGRALASGLVGNGTVELKLGLANMPLSLADVVFADLGLGGTVSGLFTYAKPREALPVGEARLVVKGLSRSGLVLTSRPVDVALVGRLDHDTLETRAVASEAGQTRGRLQARIDQLPAQGMLTDRLRSGNLFAQLRYAGPADALWRLMALDSFDLTGPVALAADVTGSIDNPRITGSLASDALHLQSALTGTDVSQISARGSFNGSQLVLSGVTGHTAGGGQVAGAGTVDFTAVRGGHGPEIDLKLGVHKAQLLARQDMALVATGPMRIVSDGTQGTIAGRLAIDSANWRLGQAASVTDLPTIPTREINRRADIAPATVNKLPWRFLVDAAGPGRVRVQGLGLDSEWSADIKLRGSIEDPAIAGSAVLVGGSYEFSGKRFELSRGRITFDGTSPPNPRLDLAASADVTGLTATVTVLGTSLKPEIAFSSVPALPEEELLSRVLFGDSITAISAPEALQLGAALAALHGGGGLDPINKLRSAIGLDRLRILSADSTIGMQTAVAAGKNIGRHVYAEIVSDGHGYSATNLEFRITRWLSLLGSVSTVGRQSVNARITHDY